MSTTSCDGLSIERSGDVMTWTLDRPGDGNEISGAMFDAMLATLRADRAQPSIRVLRIRANGPVFCTGRERAGTDIPSVRHETARLIEVKRMLRTAPFISIAEVQGDALGFGFGLAIVCDFAIVSTSAALGFPEMKMGLAPAAIMAYLGEYALPREAFPLVLFGDPIAPLDAVRIGLINAAVAPGELRANVDALVARVLALDPAAARNCKNFFQTAAQQTFETNCRFAVDALTIGSLSALARAAR